MPRAAEHLVGVPGSPAGAVLAEIHGEWQVSDRRILSEASMAKLLEHQPASQQTVVTIPAAIAS